MRDKRIYLKIASIIELIYVLIMSIYYIFFTKFSDEVIASLFLLFIGLFFGIILYKESRKELKYLKENKYKIAIAGIWLFFEPIVPGVFCFMFLRSLKAKNKLELPQIKEEKITKKDVIKSVSTILIFVFIMFILPLFSFYKTISSYTLYAVIFAVIIILYYDELKKSFLVFKTNIKKYVPFIFKRYLIMLGLMVLVAFPIVLINKGEVSSNQQAINIMFGKVPLITFILTTLYAPFAEESIFRLCISKLIHNKKVFIIASGFLFGLLHMVDKFSSFYDLLYVFQYAALGICLAKAYKDSNNIFVPMSMHFIQNFVASILVLLLY